jgi:alpha-glucoside transport system substrate-binding protein
MRAAGGRTAWLDPAGAAVVIVVLVLAGCSAPAPFTPDPVLGDLSGSTVEVVATWSGTEQANFRAVTDEFTRRTHATVRYTSGGNDLAVLINSRLAGGSPPDIAFIPQPGVVAQLARRGVLRPLTGAAEQAVLNNYSPAWRSLATMNGRLYGFHFKVADKSVIWYRVAAFEDAGVTPPSTWDELRTISRALTDAGIPPMAVGGADGWVLTDWFENAYLRLAGPDRYAALARHELPWTDPTVVATLQLLADYWRSSRFLDGGPTAAVQLSFTQSVADVFGAKPTTAMIAEGDFVAAEIRKLGKHQVGEGARFFPWPAINGSPPAVVVAGDEGVMFRDSPAATALMTFLASPEAAAIMVSRGGSLSANLNLDPSAYPDTTTRALAQEVLDAEVLRFDLSDLAPQAFGSGSTAHMWALLQDFLGRGQSAAQVAQALEDAAIRDFGACCGSP